MKLPSTHELVVTPHGEFLVVPRRSKMRSDIRVISPDARLQQSNITHVETPSTLLRAAMEIISFSTPGLATTLSGTVGIFDTINDTGEVAEGFDIGLERAVSSRVNLGGKHDGDATSPTQFRMRCSEFSASVKRHIPRTQQSDPSAGRARKGTL